MNPQPTAATTRRLLLALAASPEPDDHTASLHAASGEIRAALSEAEATDITFVPYPTLHRWRNALDTHLRALERDAPVCWARWRTPGTWLDSLLRLRSLLAHEVAKAYWDERENVAYADIDAERYLWGAR